MLSYDVVVVGGGIMGLSSAYHSVRIGKKTLLLEQFPSLHSRGSSHGGSRITCFANQDSHYQRLLEEAYPLWEALEKDTDTEIYRETGMLFVSMEMDEGYGARTLQAMRSSPYRCEKIDQEERAKRFPYYTHSPESEWFFYERAGLLRADNALGAYQSEYERLGGVLQDKEKVEEIIPGAMVTVKTHRGSYQTSSLIITPGPWAKDLLASLGLQLPLQPIAACHIYWKEKSQGAYQEFPVFNDVGPAGILFSGLLSPNHVGTVKVTPIEGAQPLDPNREDRLPAEWHMEKAKDYVREHFPGLMSEEPAILEPCAYTNTPDYNFIIDALPAHPNIVFGCGFSGHGFKFAPVIGKLLYQLATNTIPDMDILVPFSMKRFTDFNQK
ncbi:peroxisomal sarcosine oxidase-like [Diadema antillarum]|uniref:peroxisomal sarcosine oxidase-like n=1 Tax=Diadema antillarum TaxID=105358 RepID=UPI003A8BB285